MRDEDDDDDGDDDADGDDDDDDVKRGGEEGEEEGWRCPKKNKNPTLRMWGNNLSQLSFLDVLKSISR